MCPRKGHEGRVSRWLYASRERRRKALVEGPYNCPVCGRKGLTIKISQDDKRVEAMCSCGFSKGLEFRAAFEPVDYYGKVVDRCYSSK